MYAYVYIYIYTYVYIGSKIVLLAGVVLIMVNRVLVSKAHQRTSALFRLIQTFRQLSVLVAYQPVAICQTQTTQFCSLHIYIYLYLLID